MYYLYRLIVIWFQENYFSQNLNSNYENLVFTETAPTLLMIVGGLSVGVLIATFFAVFERHFIGKFLRTLLSRGAKDPESALTLEEMGLARSGILKREISRAGVTRKLIAVVDADGTVRDYESELRAAFPEYAARLDDERAAATDGEGEEESFETPLSDDQIIAEADVEGGAEPKVQTTGRKAHAAVSSRSFRPRSVDFATARFFIPEHLSYRAELRSRAKGSTPVVLIVTTVIVVAVFLLALRFIPAFVNMLDATISNFRNL